MPSIVEPITIPKRITKSKSRAIADLAPTYYVICWNDPVNFMIYVTHVFMKIFSWSKQKAEKFMKEVHEKGKSGRCWNGIAPSMRRWNRNSTIRAWRGSGASPTLQCGFRGLKMERAIVERSNFSQRAIYSILSAWQTRQRPKRIRRRWREGGWGAASGLITRVTRKCFSWSRGLTAVHLLSHNFLGFNWWV